MKKLGLLSAILTDRKKELGYNDFIVESDFH